MIYLCCGRVVHAYTFTGEGPNAAHEPTHDPKGGLVMLFTSQLVTAVSGSVGGLTGSHNKGGMYFRARAVPTISTTGPALASKARLATASAHFAGLSQAERDSWTRAGTVRPEINALGATKILSGIALHNRIHTRMVLAGDTPIDTAPIGNDPDALSTASGTFDIGVGGTTLIFTPTPLSATEHLWLEAALVDSQGIEYVEDKIRFITVDAAASTSPFDYLTTMEAALGTLTVGQKLIMFPRVYDDATGLLSQRLRVQGTIIDTP